MKLRTYILRQVNLFRVARNVLESEVMNYSKRPDLGYLYKRMLAVEGFKVERGFNHRLFDELCDEVFGEFCYKIFEELYMTSYLISYVTSFVCICNRTTCCPIWK